MIASNHFPAPRMRGRNFPLDLRLPLPQERSPGAGRWVVCRTEFALGVLTTLAVLAVSVVAIFAIRTALIRDEAVMEAQAQARVGMHFTHQGP